MVWYSMTANTPLVFDSDLRIEESDLHYARCIAPKRLTIGGAHIRGIASGQHRNVATEASG